MNDCAVCCGNARLIGAAWVAERSAAACTRWAHARVRIFGAVRMSSAAAAIVQRARRVLHKFSRFFIGVLVIKMFQKGARAREWH